MPDDRADLDRLADAIERQTVALEALTCYVYTIVAALGILDVVDPSPALAELRDRLDAERLLRRDGWRTAGDGGSGSGGQ